MLRAHLCIPIALQPAASLEIPSLSVYKQKFKVKDRRAEITGSDAYQISAAATFVKLNSDL